MIDQDKSGGPFFIVGSGRSGSTLLRMILCRHSMVAVPPETYFIAPLTEQLPLDQVLNQKQLDQAVDIMTSHYRWPDMGIARDELVSAVSAGTELYLRDVIDVVYDYYLAKDGKKIWGDKTPAYIAIVPQLLKLYPGAKVVHLIRDGRDVTKSFQATGWYGPWLHENTREWKTAITTGNHLIHSLGNEVIHVVKYEDLVLDTEITIKNLCLYLEIEYETGMLDWGRSVEGKIPAREAHIHTKIAKKPGRGDVYRWKREMTNRELFVVESFLFNELKSTGYKLHYSGSLWTPVFIGCGVWYQTIFPIYVFSLRVIRYVRRKFNVS